MGEGWRGLRKLGGWKNERLTRAREAFKRAVQEIDPW
jgi:hypothetical protein